MFPFLSSGTTLTLFLGHGSLSPALFGKDGVTIGSHTRDNRYLSFLRLGTAAFFGFETLQRLNLVPRGTSSPSFLRCTAELPKYRRLGSPGQNLTSL